jgi:two-component system, cell cycle sensor histidine kinase and response regulator CckA
MPTGPEPLDWSFLFENSADGIILMDAGGTILDANPRACEMLGYERAELATLDMASVIAPEDLERHTARRLAAMRHQVVPEERRMMRRDGTVFAIEGWGRLLSDGRIIGFMRDLEPRRLAEERRAAEVALAHSENQLRHAQRLESVGRLAGGIAHDFNNLLTVILGYSEQQIAKLAGQPLERSAQEIHKAATRAATLTRQLLAFSRKQVMEPRVLDLDVVLAEMGPMLCRLIGEDVDLLIHKGPIGGRVRADRLQIEQVVMNLVVNARDAMPNGGRLSLGTASITLDAERALRLEGLSPGPYVTLTVSDSGVGMDADVRSRLFEPFFTTKERGVGTGLGLSTAYGIVQQSGGAIDVESEPDQGATFTIYLPQVDEVAGGETGSTQKSGDEAGGHETVLLVEDEAVVRDLISDLLRGAGYRVLEATDGRSALDVADALDEPIHALVTDLVMPGMNGRELAEAMAARRPGIAVLYVSGYTRDLVARQGILESGVQLLQKPFDPQVLIARVREVLDASSRRAA